MGVTNHWTGLVDWNIGLTFLVFIHYEVTFIMHAN